MLVLCVLLFTLMSPSLIQAASLTTDFFPYGSFEGDSTLQRSNEAGSSSQIIELEEGARFYGNTYSRITVRLAYIYACTYRKGGGGGEGKGVRR